MSIQKSREALLFSAFTTLPEKIGDYELRRMSPGSYSLLIQLQNPLLVGGDSSQIMAAVAEYIWVHSAPIAQVLEVNTKADLPQADVRLISFSIDFSQAMGFLESMKNAAERMGASLAEAEPTEGAEGKQEHPPTGSLASLSPQDALETPPVNIISFGKLPSSEPSNISMPQTSPPELTCAGSMILPEMQTLPILPLNSPT